MFDGVGARQLAILLLGFSMITIGVIGLLAA